MLFFVKCDLIFFEPLLAAQICIEFFRPPPKTDIHNRVYNILLSESGVAGMFIEPVRLCMQQGSTRG
jgi:hypothetical protein